MSADPSSPAGITPDRIAGLLPAILQAGAEQEGPLAGLVDAMAALLSPGAAVIDKGASLFEPLTAPENLLRWLAHWMGHGPLFIDADNPRRLVSLEEGFPPGAAQLRQFLSAWPVLQAMRGSTDGLILTLEAATGLAGFTVSEDAERSHLHICAPAELAKQAIWLRRLIAAERPVHLTWSLAFAGGETGA